MSSKPFMQFYPSDWRGDPKLRMCSLAARGLWLELLAIMHEAEPRGHLVVNSRKPTVQQIANLVGAPVDEVESLISELAANGVFSRTRGGVIYSRKMTRGERRSRVNRENGAKGGNPTLKKTKAKSGSDNRNSNPQSPESRVQSNRESLHDHRKSPMAARAREPDAGGGRGGDPPGADYSPPSPKSTPPPLDAAEARASALKERVVAAAGVDLNRDPAPTRWLGSQARDQIACWVRELDLTDAQIIETVKEMADAKTDGPPASLAYFTRGLQRREQRLKAGLPPAPADADAPGESPAQRRARERLERDARIAADLDRQRGYTDG